MKTHLDPEFSADVNYLLRVSPSHIPKQKITLARAREVFEYDPITGYLYRRYNPKKPDVLKRVMSVTVDGYPVSRVDDEDVPIHHLAWLLHYGRYPTTLINHIDQRKDNNAISNLEESDVVLNALNSCRRPLGFFGVRRFPSGLFGAFIGSSSHSENCLGRFKSTHEAALARDIAIVRKFGLGRVPLNFKTLEEVARARMEAYFARERAAKDTGDNWSMYAQGQVSLDAIAAHRWLAYHERAIERSAKDGAA